MTDWPPGSEDCNRYTRIIIAEALERGIGVEVLDGGRGELRPSLGDRTVSTIESMSELTSAVAFRRCDHKLLTRQILERAGLRVSPGRQASFDDADLEFLDEYEDIVVKPAKGEQGWGITVGVTDAGALERAIVAARTIHDEVVLEARQDGDDLRVIVIDGAVVAASVRRPATVTSNGTDTVGQLITELSDQRSLATDGASRVPLDDATLEVVSAAGVTFETVLEDGRELPVRRTANLHTGGTMHDVTEVLHPTLVDASIAAAKAIEIPVAGIDFIVVAADQPEYTIIEVNEQPGLANHEPQPTVERFVDLLFPETVR
ncbi:hypothetical protein BH10ACT3_BH10ACT3_17230 [soil metagenome]